MSLIDGVGDEVVQFVIVVSVILVAALAWWSTNAQGRHGTVLVMRSRSFRAVSVNIRTRRFSVSNSQIESSVQEPLEQNDNNGTNTSDTVDDAGGDNATVIPVQEMDSIFDADMAMMDHNRLHFYRRVDSPQSTASASDSSEETDSQPETSSSAQVREMERIVSAMEAVDDFTTTANMQSRAHAKEKNNENRNNSVVTASNVTPEETVNTESASGADVSTSCENAGGGERRKILIKLKYLNETLKEVEGSLDELLMDFKLRHFSSELSSECRVRLIFNGRILLDDAATLRACGLHDNAVVHCLVHPNRNTTTQRAEGAETGGGAEAAEGRAWDLDNILMTLVSVALTVVWFFRCEYSNMFTASASVALFGLTVFYSVAIFGLYLSDTFHFDRRPAQTQPTNNN